MIFIWETCLNFILAFAGTVSFSLLFNVERKYYYCCGITGGIGYLAYCFAVPFLSKPVSSFLATVAIVLLSRVFAVIKKCPITVFLISGIFPIIPGANIYYTAYYFITDELQLATEMGVDSIKVAFAIVLGIIIVLAVPRKYFFPGRQIKINVKPLKGMKKQIFK